MARRLAIPVTTAWTHDLIATDDPLFCGRPGTIGERAGNFTVQNADALLVLGSRLNIRQVSYNWASFAPNAFLMQVDVDAGRTGKADRAARSADSLRPEGVSGGDAAAAAGILLRREAARKLAGVVPRASGEISGGARRSTAPRVRP